MDPTAEPSLLLAEQHIAQREHIHAHNHNKQYHNHHRSLHKRQAQDVDGVETVSVIQTISVIQQIDIDSNGNTVSTLYTPSPPPPNSPPLLTKDPSIALPSSGAPGSGGADGAANNQAPLTASPSSTPSASLPPTSSPSQSSTSSTTFSSLGAGSNSTVPAASSASRVGFSNSTISVITSSRSSSTALITPILSTIDELSTVASFSSPSSDPTSAGANGVIDGAGVASSASPSSTSASGGNNGDSQPAATPTPVIVGSVVSSIAGVAILVAILVYLWRWRQKKRNMLPLGSGENTTNTMHAPPPEPASGMMVERRSFANAVPAALASLTGMKRFSERTDNGTISSTAGSERGFYKVSGRKIESVLSSGGDGYGGGNGERAAPVNPFDDRTHATLSASSWYTDTDGGITGGPGPASPLTRLAMPPSHARDSGVPVSRPSPARTPVIERGPFTELQLPLDRPPTRPDGVGRSRPSQDGSHTSRFQEEV